jgi:hypothetical protein
MSFLPASRTKRNLIKVASLGLAGLLAGLLAGCNESPETATTTPYIPAATDSLNPNAEAQLTTLPKSLDETQIPALHHPPSSRSLQYGSVRTVSMAVAPSNGY